MEPRISAGQDQARILIVEDSASQALQLQQTLQRHGYRVSVARDGEDALVSMKERRPALVISDILMPAMDGYELTRRIRADQEIGDVPVILLTQLFDPKDVIRALQCGADNFVTKPYDERLLLSRIQSALAGQPLRGQGVGEGYIELQFAEERHIIPAQPSRVANFLLSTYEGTILNNLELARTRDELRALNGRLEALVEARTAALKAEVAERRRTERSLHEAIGELHRRNAETAALLESSRALLEHRAFKDSVKPIFSTCKRLIRAGAGYIRLLSGEGTPGEILCLELGGAACTVKPSHPMSLRGLAWEASSTGQAALCNRFPESEFAHLVPEGHIPIDSALQVPMVIEGRAVGLLALANKPGGFTDNDARIAKAFADLAAVAIHNSRTRDQLEDSEQRFRAVVETATDAIICIDSRGSIVSWNRGAEAAFGYSASEAIGKSITLMMPERYRNAHVRGLQRLTSTGEPSLIGKTAELAGLRRDGSEFPLELSLATWRNKQDICFTGMVRDITERKRMEQEVLRAQRLEAAGRIAGQVAHDFNNLLTPLISYPELIKMQLPEGHPAVPFCDAMVEAAEQMAEINSDMMALSRRGHLEQQPSSINEVVQQAMERLPEWPESLALWLDLAPGLPPASGSPAQLHRVVSNLLLNARDAMQDTGLLAIKTENVHVAQPFGRYNRVDAGDYVRLSVRDTGCGIPPEIRDRVFEPFFSTKRADERRGSGLGLSIVQAIVEDHQGYLDLESEVGVGTTFTVYLPIYQQAISEMPGRSPRTGSETILVVDDNRFQREAVRALLRQLGYRPDVAASGEEAVAFVTRQPVDLLMLDVAMPPGIDGTETYRRVLEIRPGQRAIIVSGFAESERVREARALGAGSYQRKPVTLERLALAVRQELDRDRDREDNRMSPVEYQSRME